jgi:hypothetical protein
MCKETVIIYFKALFCHLNYLYGLTEMATGQTVSGSKFKEGTPECEIGEVIT